MIISVESSNLAKRTQESTLNLATIDTNRKVTNNCIKNIRAPQNDLQKSNQNRFSHIFVKADTRLITIEIFIKKAYYAIL